MVNFVLGCFWKRFQGSPVTFCCPVFMTKITDLLKKVIEGNYIDLAITVIKMSKNVVAKHFDIHQRLFRKQKFPFMDIQTTLQDNPLHLDKLQNQYFLFS
jgi:hypothetical protein